MPSNAKASTASGLAPHLESPRVGGVADASAPRLPRPNVEQYPVDPRMQGLNEALNPVLRLAGAYYDEEGYLVRDVIVNAGAPRVVDGRERWPILRKQRHVAPAGMSIEDARLKGLDFFSPQVGWVRGGVKIEREHPSNMGTGNTLNGVEWVDAEADDASEEV